MEYPNTDREAKMMRAEELLRELREDVLSAPWQPEYQGEIACELSAILDEYIRKYGKP